MNIFKITSVALIMLISSGCVTQQPTVTDYVNASHYRVLERAEAHQEFFRNNIQAGMTKEQVRQLVIQTNQNNEGEWYKDGKPSSSSFQVVNNVTYEMWEYSYYSKVFVLTFQDGRLVKFTDKPGKTVMDGR